MLSHLRRVKLVLNLKIYQLGGANQRHFLQPTSKLSTWSRPHQSFGHPGQFILFPGQLNTHTNKKNKNLTSSPLCRNYGAGMSRQELYLELLVQVFEERLKNPTLPLSPLEDGVLSTIFLENKELLLLFLNTFMKEIQDGPEITEVKQQNLLDKIQKVKPFLGNESWLNLTCKTRIGESFNMYIQFRGPTVKNEANCQRLVAQATLLHSSQLFENDDNSEIYSFIYGHEGQKFQETQKDRFKKSYIVYICRKGWPEKGDLIYEYQGFLNLRDVKDDSLNDMKIIVVNLKILDHARVGYFENISEIEKWFAFFFRLHIFVQIRRTYEILDEVDRFFVGLVPKQGNPHLSLVYDKLNDLETYRKLSDEQKERYTFNTLDGNLWEDVGKLIGAKQRGEVKKANLKTALILHKQMKNISIEDAKRLAKEQLEDAQDNTFPKGGGIWDHVPEDAKEQYLLDILDNGERKCDYVSEIVQSSVGETIQAAKKEKVQLLSKRLNISLGDAKRLWEDEDDLSFLNPMTF